MSRENIAIDVNHPSVQGFLGRKRDRMNEKVELPPFLLNLLEHRLGLSGSTDVERPGFKAMLGYKFAAHRRKCM